MAIIDRIKQYEENKKKYPHLQEYIEQWVAQGNKEPNPYSNLQSDMAKLKEFNFIYPVQPPMFIHVYKMGITGKRYITIEPKMSDDTHDKYDVILQSILKEAPYEKAHETKKEFEDTLDRLMVKVTTRDRSAARSPW